MRTVNSLLPSASHRNFFPCDAEYFAFHLENGFPRFVRNGRAVSPRHDFIFDKIEYTDELEEFIEHARTCKKCREDLELYYLINRGLGDVPAPDNSGEDVGYDQELEDIFSFYDEWFTKQKKQKWATKISNVVCGIIVICIIGFLIGVLIGYI